MFYNQDMHYICQNCGGYFDQPAQAKEHRGEHFGFTAEERTDCCPYCGGAYEGVILKSMNRGSWRRETKNALYCYEENRRRMKALENDLIWSQGRHRDQKYHGGISDPTAVKSVLMTQGELGHLHKQVRAVEKLLASLNDERRDNRYKLALLQMVYLRRSHTLYGAAAYLGIPERTAHRWISRMLIQLAEYLGFLDEDKQE